MFLKMMNGSETHVQITPGGIAVLNCVADATYTTTHEQTIGHLWALSLSSRRGSSLRPIWCLHVINSTVMNREWIDELTTPTECSVDEAISMQLDEVDCHFDLHLHDIFRRALCLQQYHFGLSESRSSERALKASA